jgi:hypothetical protein
MISTDLVQSEYPPSPSVEALITFDIQRFNKQGSENLDFSKILKTQIKT